MNSIMKIASSFVLALWVLVAIATIIMLNGCSTIQPYAEQGLDSAREVNDSFLGAAELAYCDGPTHGALSRRYGSDPAIQQARNNLCGLISQKYYQTTEQ